MAARRPRAHAGRMRSGPYVPNLTRPEDRAVLLGSPGSSTNGNLTGAEALGRIRRLRDAEDARRVLLVPLQPRDHRPGAVGGDEHLVGLAERHPLADVGRECGRLPAAVWQPGSAGGASLSPRRRFRVATNPSHLRTRRAIQSP